MTKSVLIQTLVRQSQEIKIRLRSALLNVENSEVMQLNYKRNERSQEFLVIIISQKSSFS